MRKLLVMGLLLLTGACSVENDSMSTDEIKEFNALATIDGCRVYNLNFGTDGLISFRNYYDYLEVTVTNISGADMNNISIHYTKDSNNFPLTGKGDLNTSKFFYSENVNKGVSEVTIQFSFDELNILNGENLFITAAVEFGSGKNKREVFIEDENLLMGNDFYFTYNVEKFPNYAGTDQVREISLSNAIAVPSWDEVRKLYAGMLDPGVSRNTGTYSPSIWDIINDFNDPNRESKVDEYTTTYTLGSGDCLDSVELTLRVIPDPL